MGKMSSEASSTSEAKQITFDLIWFDKWWKQVGAGRHYKKTVSLKWIQVCLNNSNG